MRCFTPPVQALLRHGVTAKPHIRQVQILQVGMLTQGQTEVQLKSHWEGNTTHILAPKNWENLGVFDQQNILKHGSFRYLYFRQSRIILGVWDILGVQLDIG